MRPGRGARRALLVRRRDLVGRLRVGERLRRNAMVFLLYFFGR